MITFITAEIREQFHALPIDTQMEWNDFAEAHFAYGEVLTVLYVDASDGGLEISVRIDKQFDSAASGVMLN